MPHEGMRNLIFGLSGPSLVACRRDDPLARFIDDHVAGIVLRDIDAGDCRLLDPFYDQLVAVMGFPDYFGRNLAAFADCMSDELGKDKSRRPTVGRATAQVLRGSRVWLAQAIPLQ